MTEHILILYISGSEYYDLHCILAELIHDVIHKVESLLVCQTGNHTDQHDMRILVQSQFFLKRRLIDHFVLAEILDRKVLCDP